MTGRKLFLAVSVLLLTLPVLAPVRVLAADVKTRSSTQYLLYNDPFQDKTQGNLLQYVKFSATKTDTTAVELRAACNGKFVSCDPGPMCASRWYAAQPLYHVPDELDDGSLNRAFRFPGKPLS